MNLAASYGPVEDIEVLWTLIAVIGLIFSIYNYRESKKDLETLASLGIANGRYAIAKTGVKAELSRAIKQVIFIVIGLFAMYLPGQDTSAFPLIYNLFGIFFRWGLITASALTSYQSYLVWDLRRTLWGTTPPPRSQSHQD